MESIETNGFLSSTSEINTYSSFLATGIEKTPGSFRLTNGAYNGSSFSPKYYASAWAGGSTARITTYNIGKIGKGIGQVGFGAGVLLDTYGVANYYNNGSQHSNSVHPGKAAVNTGMGAWGLLGGPYGAIMSGAYSGIELFYPGGMNGLLNDQVKFTKENQKVLEPTWRMVPFSNK